MMLSSLLDVPNSLLWVQILVSLLL